MTIIEVTDPETHETFWLATVKGKNGKEHYQRLPATNFDVSIRSPRQLEASAAFAEVASKAYGRRSTPTEQAAARAVRTTMRVAFPKGPTAKQLRAQEQQARYAAMLTPEERAELSAFAGARSSVRFSRRRRYGLPELPVSRRNVPSLDQLPAPGYF